MIREMLFVAGSLQPFVIYIFLSLYVIFRRTSRSFIILSSLFLSEQIVDKILKQIFREARPPGACALSYGFPSGHSAFAGNLITWLILESVAYVQDAPFKKPFHYKVMRNFLLIFTPINPISRYYLNYHSIKQIGFGLLTGSVLSMLYFNFIRSIHQNKQSYLYLKIVKIMKILKFNDNFLGYTVINNEVFTPEGGDVGISFRDELSFDSKETSETVGTY